MWYLTAWVNFNGFYWHVVKTAARSQILKKNTVYVKHCISSCRTRMIISAFSYRSLTNHNYSPITGGRFEHDSVLHWSTATALLRSLPCSRQKALPPPPPRPPAAWPESKMHPKSFGLQRFASVSTLVYKNRGFGIASPRCDLARCLSNPWSIWEWSHQRKSLTVHHLSQ